MRAHLRGDEVAVAQHLAQRHLEMAERGGERTAAQLRDVRDGAGAFQTAQHVGRSVGKEGVGIEEVGTAEHVEQRLPRRGHVLAGPGANLGKLAALEASPCRIEVLGVLLPDRLARQRRERRCGGWLQPGQEPGGVIEARALDSLGSERCIEQETCDESGDCQ